MAVHDVFDNNLSLISTIHPAATLLHIGAGGAGNRVTEIVKARSYILVEADERRAERLASDYEGRREVDTIQAVVACKDGGADFFKLSIADESGTLDARALKTVWPNIETIDILPTQAMSLASIVNKKSISGGPQAQPNWIVISCLQVFDLLIGARDILRAADVIVARVVLTKPDNDTALNSSAHETLLSALIDVGFAEVFVHPERNAKLARVAYVRDWKKQAQTQQKDAEKLLQKAEAKSAAAIDNERAEIVATSDEKNNIANDLASAKAQTEDLAEKFKDSTIKIDTQNKQLSEANNERERAEKNSGLPRTI